MTRAEDVDLLDQFEELYQRYYRDAIGDLAQNYPGEQRSLYIDWSEDLYRYDPDLADDYLAQPDQMREYAEEALRLYDLPVDVSLGQAHVRVQNLASEDTYYPGGYSPTSEKGSLVAVRGEVVQAGGTYAKIEEAAFECQRCGTLTYIPQSGGDFQDPHECQGCERQGPFQINFTQSEFVDGQKLRVQEPPEIASGEGETLDIFCEDDLVERVVVGDRVIANGVLQLEQRGSGNQKKATFDCYLDAVSIEVQETDHREIDITDDERATIEAIAAGEHGDPLDLAADSLAPKIVGYQHIKEMSILQMVGGSRVVYPDGSADRGDIHMLVLGDPGTTKSKFLGRIEEVSPRAVGVSGKGATEAGLLASAVQDDFSEADWTLKAGAFVKANEGIVTIDELDDMPADVRAAMLDPMSKQKINVNKAGINATLSTQTGVAAAGNPKYGRFDPYEPIAEQFDLEGNLLSRFDVIYCIYDQPDPDEDFEIADHISQARDAAKKYQRDSESLSDAELDRIDTPIDADLLTKYIALAKRQPAPVFASDELRQEKARQFTELRGANGYDADSPVPVTFRKWEAIIRIMEAYAKFEFSDTIEERHADRVLDLVGRSLSDYGKNEERELDADIKETGESTSQKDRMKIVEEVIKDLQSDSPTVPREDIISEADERAGLAASKVSNALDKMATEHGWIYEPEKGKTVKWLGRR